MSARRIASVPPEAIDIPQLPFRNTVKKSDAG